MTTNLHWTEKTDLITAHVDYDLWDTKGRRVGHDFIILKCPRGLSVNTRITRDGRHFGAVQSEEYLATLELAKEYLEGKAARLAAGVKRNKNFKGKKT